LGYQRSGIVEVENRSREEVKVWGLLWMARELPTEQGAKGW